MFGGFTTLPDLVFLTICSLDSLLRLFSPCSSRTGSFSSRSLYSSLVSSLGLGCSTCFISGSSISSHSGVSFTLRRCVRFLLYSRLPDFTTVVGPWIFGFANNNTFLLEPIFTSYSYHVSRFQGFQWLGCAIVILLLLHALDNTVTAFGFSLSPLVVAVVVLR